MPVGLVSVRHRAAASSRQPFSRPYHSARQAVRGWDGRL